MKLRVWKRARLVCMAAFLLCLTVCGQAMAAAKSEDPARFVEGTKINGLGVSGMNVEEAKAFIESFYQGKYTLRIKEQEEKQEILHDTDISYKAVVSGDLNAVLTAENEAGRPSGPDVDNRYTVEISASYDENLLNQELQKLNCVRSAKTTQDAYISGYAEGKPFEIIPEIQGNDVDLGKLTAAVKDALNKQQEELDLEAAGCYRKVQVTSQNEELKQLCDLMNQCVNVNITYVFGDQQEVLSGQQICKWLEGSSGMAIQVARDQAAAYVKTLADKYDTYGKPHAFHTSKGEDVTVSGPYGWKINQAEETNALISMIQTGQSQSREPAYSKKAASRSGNDYGSTYVEVDLKNQHMYLYENGTCVTDSPFVSGNVSKDWATPNGLYSLYYKQTDKVLKGEDYETPVKFWMPFNGGIGLHDANWRGTFGGQIYRTGGSHGCINLPPAIAAKVYEHVYAGIPVICHSAVE